MDKTWLIRTKNNHILGPVTKDKVRELIEQGSIKGEDEVCAGNGYWFYIREKDLINKYITGDVPQGFNPVSEAETVLCIKSSAPTKEANNSHSSEADNSSLPSDDDLAYPDMQDLETSNTASTTILNVNDLKVQLNTIPDEEAEPIVEENETSNMSLDALEEVDEDEEDEFKSQYTKKKVKLTQKRIKKKSGNVKVKQRNDNILMYLAFLFLAIAIGVFIYRKNFLKKFIGNFSHHLILDKAYAQVTTPVVNTPKKK